MGTALRGKDHIGQMAVNTMTMNMKTLFFVVCLLSSINGYAQSVQLQRQLDSLKYVKGNPFECNSITWKIIAHKKEAIQVLINKLDDTSLTLATDPCKHSRLRVGDLAYLTLKEILPLPFYLVTGMRCDVIEGNCQLGVFEYIENNRAKFKQQVQDYYNGNEKKLK